MLPELRRLAVRAYLQRLALDDKPIICGPWRSEVGFEAMYWLPFLKWAVKAHGISCGRLIVVTRGGAGSLYAVPVYPDGSGHHVPESVDLYSLRSVTEVRRENLYDWTTTKLQKQMACTAWDRQVLKDAAERVLGKDARYHVLHPAWMYWALEPFWNEERGLQYLLSMTDFSLLPKPQMPHAMYGEMTTPEKDGTLCFADMHLKLPDRFVAMKFYGRSTFPHPHPETHAFVAHIAATVAAQTPVVLLNSGHVGDEHGDIDVTGPNIHRLPSVSPEQNLALQAAVLGKATAFVGTYGGVSQLALRMGIPSASFYAEWGGTAEAHLALSGFLSRRTKVPFLVGSLDDVHLWQQLVSMPVKTEAAA